MALRKHQVAQWGIKLSWNYNVDGLSRAVTEVEFEGLWPEAEGEIS